MLTFLPVSESCSFEYGVQNGRDCFPDKIGADLLFHVQFRLIISDTKIGLIFNDFEYF